MLGFLLNFIKSSSPEKIAGQLLILHKINHKYRKKLKEKDEMIKLLKHTIENQNKGEF